MGYVSDAIATLPLYHQLIQPPEAQLPKVQLRLPCLDITVPLSSSKSKPTRARIYSFEEVSTHPCDPAALETPLRHVPYQSKSIHWANRNHSPSTTHGAWETQLSTGLERRRTRVLT